MTIPAHRRGPAARVIVCALIAMDVAVTVVATGHTDAVAAVIVPGYTATTTCSDGSEQTLTITTRSCQVGSVEGPP